MLVGLVGGACDTSAGGGEGEVGRDERARREHHDRARELIDAERWDEAVQSLERAIEADPLAAEAHYLLGVVLLQHFHDEPRAIECLEEARRLAPGDPKVLVQLADLAFKRADYEAALSHATRATKSRKIYPKAHYLRGLILSSMGRLGQAEKAFRRAVDVGTGYPDARFELGLLKLERQDLEGSKAVFEQVLAADPGHLGARYNLGRVLAQLGDEESARRELHLHDLLRALRQEPDVDRSASLEQREAILREVLELLPHYPPAVIELAGIESERGRTQEGIELLARLVESRPFAFAGHLKLAELYEKQGDRARAASSREVYRKLRAAAEEP